ncbi:unnamed protein product [Schistocephalus solidus]|uniref:Mothers against decapentaplegic homolog 6 n=1 Tax=Schistocephalus solidus TaxID=70667 RepID=A0A183T2T7_SCHSO|nr:unnamed protein product [Schistocephalus solidus]
MSIRPVVDHDQKKLTEVDSGCVPDCSEGQRNIQPWSHISYWECNHHIGHRWLPVSETDVIVLNDEATGSALDLTLPSGLFTSNPSSSGQLLSTLTSTTNLWSRRGHLCLERLVRRCAAFRSDTAAPRARYQLNHLLGCQPDLTYNFSCIQRRSDCQHLGTSTRQRLRLGAKGISLLLLPDGQVLLTNRTLAPSMPIFVASPCFVMDGHDLISDWPVARVAPGHSLTVFDLGVYQKLCGSQDPTQHWPGKSLAGPVVHISLGKGWGPSYRRPDITFCPSRLELWLNLPAMKTLLRK